MNIKVAGRLESLAILGIFQKHIEECTADTKCLCEEIALSMEPLVD